MSKPKPYTLSFELKPLSEEAYTAAPEAVRKVYISLIENIPLVSEVIKATVKAHPEYFTLKEKKVKKSFGQNFKRMSNLRRHKESFQKKITIAKKKDVEFPPSCSGDCGLGYCDTNGCMERKRELVDPSELPGLEETLSYPHPCKITLQSTNPGLTEEQIEWAKSLPKEEDGLPPLPEGQKEFIRNLKKQ